MKLKHYLFGGLMVALIALYFVDRHVWMKKRVMRHGMWENTGGEAVRGDFIYTEYIDSFKNDSMIFHYQYRENDTLIFKWQYFNTMKVKDPKTRKTGLYEMKGRNWMNYLSK